MNIFKKQNLSLNGLSMLNGNKHENPASTPDDTANNDSTSGKSSPTTPSFKFKSKFKTRNKSTSPLLNIPVTQQREKFDDLNNLESSRIIEGLNDPQNSIWSLTASIAKLNKNRNRYTNVSPWDSTRVKLPITNDSPYSDYINASYVNLKLPRFTHDPSENSICDEYIACQGPLKSTINHFWSMCYNESETQNNDTVVILMVTPLTEQGMIKCDKYWPELGEYWNFSEKNSLDGLKFTDLCVKNVNETSYDQDYLLTELELTLNGTIKKTVYHFYYYNWSDAKVPPSIDPLIKLSVHINEIQEMTVSNTSGSSKPVPIVHCSAGVGRSGTFIAFDHLYKHKSHFKNLVDGVKENDANDGNKVVKKDMIYKIVYQLRSQRMMMVQTIHQYNFLYDVFRFIYNE